MAVPERALINVLAPNPIAITGRGTI